MKRPSHKELYGKIEAAKLAVEQGNIKYVDPFTLAIDASELGYVFQTNILKIFSDLLAVVTPDDYVGSRPPQRSYELIINGMDLFAFKVKGSFLKDVVYFKFSIKRNYCYIVSLHKNR